MSDNKRNILTRQKIIMMMGKTEKDFIKEGATIQNMEPIFIKYRLKVRMFDALVEKILYKYDPPFPDSHAKPFYCMVKDNHIYVLNYDLKTLEQTQNDEGDKNEHMHLKTFILSKKKMKMMRNVK
jgi:hypothetical protein